MDKNESLDNYCNPANLILLKRMDSGIAVLTFNFPPLNLFSLEMTRALDWRLHEIENDQNIRCLVVTGAGDKCFGAGSDIKEFPELIETNTIIERKLRYEMEVHEKLQNLPQPTIAAVNGIALGGGLELALCCDLRIMAKDTYLGFPEINLGVYPGTGMVLLPSLIGEARAKELLYLGKTISANEALQWGLVNKVVPKQDVIEVAIKLAREIATHPFVTEKIIKRGFKIVYHTKSSRKEKINICLSLSEEAFSTMDVKEAIYAFIEKRKAKFIHR